jgi:curved DNA-binding protein CbpA
VYEWQISPNGGAVKDPYDVLGLARTAMADEIRKAYRSLAKTLHPDLNPGDKDAEARFKEASAIYDLLSEPEERRRFDGGEINASGQEGRHRG